MNEEDVEMSCGFEKPKRPKSLNCDQVVWLLDVADRYLPHDGYVRASQQREMKKYGMLYEVMDVLGIDFEDEAARNNGTPAPARK